MKTEIELIQAEALEAEIVWYKQLMDYYTKVEKDARYLKEQYAMSIDKLYLLTSNK